LRLCIPETVSRRAISRGWEGLLRLGASVKHGWYPATEALDRFGRRRRPRLRSGDGLGKFLRTLYLCDYFGNPVFRTEILDLLNRISGHILAVHDLTSDRRSCANQRWIFPEGLAANVRANGAADDNPDY
jgi:TnpA family transposase